MRADIAGLVAAWDKKTAKKAKNYGRQLESLGGQLGPEQALCVVPASAYDPESETNLAWGVLCLTATQIVYLARTGQARFQLEDIDEVNAFRGGGSSMLVSMMTGGLIELSVVGSGSSFFEIETQSATATLWPLLQEHWAAAKEASRTRPKQPANHGSTSVADELAKLAALRDQGIISSDDFERQKQRLLG